MELYLSDQCSVCKRYDFDSLRRCAACRKITCTSCRRDRHHGQNVEKFCSPSCKNEYERLERAFKENPWK